MKNIISFILIGILTAGCVGQMSAEDQATVERLDAELITLEEGLKTGEITVAEFADQVGKIREEIKNIESASAAEIALYGGLGGIGGRTVLHGLRVAVPFIPAPWGLAAQGLISLLLGGSAAGATDKKKKK